MQKDLHTWFSSCTTAERSQGDPVLVFGRGIAKALQCFTNEIWSNGFEHSHKSIDDMVGSPDKARVLDMLVLFKVMDVACSFLHPTRSRLHHPSYNAMNLSQEELDYSSGRSSAVSHVFSSMGGNLAKNNLSAGLARSLHTLHFVPSWRGPKMDTHVQYNQCIPYLTVCGSCSSKIALTQFLDEVQPLLPASPRWGNNSILSDMLQDESAIVEQGWFLGEWFSDVILLIQQEHVLGSEARIAAATQVWLDENRSRWGEISRQRRFP
ncbi:hypothetical protein EDD85DRAFT_790215 [Armillaria nabsnona]|nr:hypothetical protein EDD85DRAFT_790215 [Armillaria nabsnona]